MLQTSSPALSFLTYTALLLRTFELHIGLPVVALTLIALLTRAHRSAVLLALCAGVTLSPLVWSYIPSARTREAQQFITSTNGNAATIRVLTLNLLFNHHDYDAALVEVRRLDPDIICFIEYTPHSAAFFERVLSAEYAHIIAQPASHPYGAAVYSRLPILDAQGRTQNETAIDNENVWIPDVDFGPDFLGPQIRVVIRHLARPVAIRAIHLTSPGGPEYHDQQRAEIHKLITLVNDDLTRYPAVILAGDFNATPNSALMHALHRAGLRESAAELGLGPTPTWPRVTPLRHFPNIRLDHVMGTRAVRFTTGGRTKDTGSDHRGVWADILIATGSQHPTP